MTSEQFTALLQFLNAHQSIVVEVSFKSDVRELRRDAGIKFREWMKLHSVTATALAKHLGMSINSLKAITCGRRHFRPETFDRAATYLHMTPQLISELKLHMTTQEEKK